MQDDEGRLRRHRRCNVRVSGRAWRCFWSFGEAGISAAEQQRHDGVPELRWGVGRYDREGSRGGRHDFDEANSGSGWIWRVCLLQGFRGQSCWNSHFDLMFWTAAIEGAIETAGPDCQEAS